MNEQFAKIVNKINRTTSGLFAPVLGKIAFYKEKRISIELNNDSVTICRVNVKKKKITHLIHRSFELTDPEINLEKKPKFYSDKIAKILAEKKFLGFEANIYVYDPFVNKQIIETNKCNKIDFADGLVLADFISIHIPLNKETKNLIAKEELKQMKENCILVNTARGGIINEKDLIWALTNKKIYGAGLDVFETEPPLKDNPLFQLDNVLLTPHNAALTLECRKRMAVETCENIAYYLTSSDRLNKNNIINKKLLKLI